MPENGYPVGYKKPPKNGRFKPGVSGNPSGRPKGTTNVATVFGRILREKVRVNGPDGPRWMPKLEVALNQLVNKALNGEPKALRELIHWTNIFGDAPEPAAPPKMFIRFVETEGGKLAPPRPGIERTLPLDEWVRQRSK